MPGFDEREIVAGGDDAAVEHDQVVLLRLEQDHGLSAAAGESKQGENADDAQAVAA